MKEAFKAMLREKHPGLLVNALVDHLVDCYHGAGTVYPVAMFPAHSFTPRVGHVLTQMGFLKTSWVFDNGDRDGDYDLLPVATAEAEEAIRSGDFYHPETGDPIPNPHLRPHVVYESGSVLDEIAKPYFVTREDRYRLALESILALAVATPIGSAGQSDALTAIEKMAREALK